jgi:hypothetical protein
MKNVRKNIGTSTFFPREGPHRTSVRMYSIGGYKSKEVITNVRAAVRVR